MTQNISKTITEPSQSFFQNSGRNKSQIQLAGNLYTWRHYPITTIFLTTRRIGSRHL